MTAAATKSVDPYHAEYDGFYMMKWHDQENELKRWFDNYKVEKHIGFATEYECLVVTEIESTSKRGGKRYHCDIIDESRGSHREAIIDHTAPPPPCVFFAAKRKYEPPPPKTAEQLRMEAEAEYMYRRGMRLLRVPVRSPMAYLDGPDFTAEALMREVEYRTEWVKPSSFLREPNFKPAPPPPAPKHRRNV